MLREYDILFYKGNSFLSRLIKRKTHSVYSHVALVLDDKHLLQINWNHRIKIEHIAYTKKKYDVYRLQLELSPFQKMRIKKFIYQTLNTQYDFKEIIGILLKFNIRTNNKKFICSSWINECFKSIGISLNKDKLVTPQNLITNLLYKVK